MERIEGGTRVGCPVSKNEKRKNIGAWFSATGRREGARSSFYDVTWLDDTRPISIFFILRPTEALFFSLSLSPPRVSCHRISRTETSGFFVRFAPCTSSTDRWPFLEKDRGTKRWKKERVGQWWAKFSS